MNKEAQFAIMLAVSFAVTLIGLAMVYLALAPSHLHKDDANRTQFRRWLAATTYRLLKARD